MKQFIATLFLAITVGGSIPVMAAPATPVISDVLVWQPEPGGVKFLIPKVPGQTPAQFVQNYMRNLRGSRTYGGMEGAQMVRWSTAPATFSELPVSTAEHPNIQVVLNRPNQMVDGARRVRTNLTTGESRSERVKSPYLKKAMKSFEDEGARLFATPVGLETVLTPQQMQQFRKRLNGMDGQFGVGGDDAHPRSWGSRDTSQTLGDIRLERDLQQTAYMKEYLKNGKGKVFYVCGSMQRAAIADGHGFHADIAHLGGGPQRGASAPAMIEIVAEPGSELATAAESTRFATSNYHHAGVDKDNVQAGRTPESRITAYNINPDGSRGSIVKSIEFGDNAGFATQFHPEFRGSIEESKIVRYVATGWKMRTRASPRAVKSCMQRSLTALIESHGGGFAP